MSLSLGVRPELLVAASLAGAASIAHCAAMCGPLAAASSRRSPRGGLAYHSGRLLSTTAIGALLGLSGGTLTRFLAADWAHLATSLLVSSSLLWSAYRIWYRPERGLVSLHRSKQRRVVGWTGEIWARALRGGLAHPFAIGVLTVLLPCGTLYAAFAIAASAANPLGGAVAMLAFASVSGIGLLVVSVIATRLRHSLGQDPIVRSIFATVLVLGAIVTLLRPVMAVCH